MGLVGAQRERRLQRLAEELEEAGFPRSAETASDALLLAEIDHALRPTVHERRIASSGSIVDPASEAVEWTSRTSLDVVRTAVADHDLDVARLFADGLACWLLRRSNGDDEWVMFDRPAGSERDLVVLADAFGANVVQRHPSGSVRVVGDFGVLRWDGLRWHLERPLSAWIDLVTGGEASGDRDVLRALLDFAVHDLGSLGIGAILIHRPRGHPAPPVEERLPNPPALDIRTPFHLAALRHALTHIDGAAVFDDSGVLRQLGVRVVPSPTAEQRIDPLGGTRHTSARRYSFDDSSATVIVVSEDGPVSVLRAGEIVGRSPIVD